MTPIKWPWNFFIANCLKKGRKTHSQEDIFYHKEKVQITGVGKSHGQDPWIVCGYQAPERLNDLPKVIVC